MSPNEVRLAPESGKWRGMRFVIVTAALVFAGLAILGALTVGYAVAGFAIVAAAGLLAGRAGEEVGRLARPIIVAGRAGEPLEAVVAGLPDPVIALDKNVSSILNACRLSAVWK